MREEITAYLEHADSSYEDGLALLSRFSRNRQLIATLSRKKWDDKLRYELTKLVGVQVALKVSEPSELPQNPSAKLTSLNMSYDDLPDECKAIFDMALDHYRESRSIHEAMRAAKTDSDRAKARTELLAKVEQYKAEFAKIDLWKQTGELPQEASAPIIDTNPTHEAINAASTNLSRLLSSIGLTKNEAKREEKIEKIKECVAVLQLANVEFTEKRITRLTELGILP